MTNGSGRAGSRPSAPGAEELPSMTLLDHLDELRKRIIRSLIALSLAIGASWSFREQIFQFLAAPIQPYLPEGRKLAFLAVTDPFTIYFKLSALAGIFIASPFLIYQIYAFVAPGLYRRERRASVPFVLCGTLFFLMGGYFAYRVAFPFAVEFLLGMGESFEAIITVQKYFGFLMTMVLGLGLMFELPIFLFLLATFGVVTPSFLLRHFRWAVLLIFVVAAIITPTPDVVNLMIFALPTIGLYLIGVAAAWVVVRGKRKKKAEAEAAAEDEP
jgi:sec-independent protein translocase protein TatC